MSRLVDALLAFSFYFLFKVRLSKLQKTKKYQHVAGPAAKMLIGDKKKEVIGRVQTRK